MLGKFLTKTKPIIINQTNDKVLTIKVVNDETNGLPPALIKAAVV